MVTIDDKWTAKIELCVIRQIFELIQSIKDRTNPAYIGERFVASDGVGT